MEETSIHITHPQIQTYLKANISWTLQQLRFGPKSFLVSIYLFYLSTAPHQSNVYINAYVCVYAEPNGQNFHAYVIGWCALRKNFD